MAVESKAAAADTDQTAGGTEEVIPLNKQTDFLDLSQVGENQCLFPYYFLADSDPTVTSKGIQPGHFIC